MITKGTRSVLSTVEVSWGVSASVRVIIVNSLYFPLKKIAVIATFVKIVDKLTGTEREGLVG